MSTPVSTKPVSAAGDEARDSAPRVRPSSYEIWVAGGFDPDLFEDDGMQVSAVGSGAVLRGTLVDSAALHGLLARLRHAGLHLVELRRLPDGPP